MRTGERISGLFFSLRASEHIFIGCLLGRPSAAGKLYFLRSIKAIPESLPDSLTWKMGFSRGAREIFHTRTTHTRYCGCETPTNSWLGEGTY